MVTTEYEPRADSVVILDAAWDAVQSVPYRVTARWVFYRLLQAGVYEGKGGYRHLVNLLSKARKRFYMGWTPETLADDTRAAQVRGDGYSNARAWLRAVQRRLECQLDRWRNQPEYVECWFEAAAMESQFEYYADENIPLLAFHGDVSIPEKWTAAERLAKRFVVLRKPIRILYYGDLDPKGLEIPQSAWNDVLPWAVKFVQKLGGRVQDFLDTVSFERVALNRGDEVVYNIPENPEREGTYQWEALPDEAASQLIARANENLDASAFAETELAERDAADRVRRHLDGLEF